MSHPAFAQSPAVRIETPGWTVAESLGVQVLGTDNVFQTERDRRADLITSVTPSLLVNADTQRLQATLSYAPNAQLYAFTAHQNQVDQEFNGQALITLVPDQLFLSLRGNATQQATAGGYAPTGTSELPDRQRTQTANFAVFPYARHRFGGWGTAEVGYDFQSSTQTGTALTLPGQSTPYFANQYLLTHEVYADFKTGENLSRLNSDTRADASYYDGTGVLRGGHQTFVTEDVGYALTRSITLLGEIGYESIRYSGTPTTRIDDPVWSLGARVTPNPDSTITVRYGHRYGFNDAYLNGVYALSPHTRVYAQYTDVLGTDLQAGQATLSTSTLDPTGNPLDRDTGAPLLLANQFFGLQNSLTRTRQVTASVITEVARNTVTLGITHEEQRLIATAPGFSGYSQIGTTGTLSWSRDINPRTILGSYLSYGTLSSPAAVSILGASPTGRIQQRVFTADASITYRFTETLLGSAQYILTNRAADQAIARSLQNAVIFGLVKRF